MFLQLRVALQFPLSIMGDEHTTLGMLLQYNRFNLFSDEALRVYMQVNEPGEINVDIGLLACLK